MGQLPGSKYNCSTASISKCGGYVPHDNFSKRDDVLTNIAFKLDGNGELLIIPGVDPTASSPDTNFCHLMQTLNLGHSHQKKVQIKLIWVATSVSPMKILI